jgi:hypothetical protein
LVNPAHFRVKTKTKSDSDGKVLESLKEKTRAMTQEQKVIRAKVGVLKLAKQLGNVSQTCRVMGYSRDSF